MSERGDGPGEPPAIGDGAPPTPPPLTPPPIAPPPIEQWPAPDPAGPVVAWPAPGARDVLASVAPYDGGSPPFTVGALLRDTFARFGADPFRLIVLTAITAVISLASSYSSFTSNPLFGGTLTTSEAPGLLSLANIIVGLVFASATFALLEGGPAIGLWRAIRRGFERSVWYFVTGLLLGLALGGVFLVAAIPMVIVAGNPTLLVLVLLIAVPVIVWLAIRLSLAPVAVVVDNIGGLDALKLSWRITRPLGVAMRVLAAGLAAGLLVAPAGAGAAALVLAGIFGRQPAFLFAASILVAAVGPLSSALQFSAYRRLVAPIQPSWTATALAAGQGGSWMSAPIVARPWVAPRFGGGARVIVGLLIVLSIAGIASTAYVASEFLAGRITLPRFNPSAGFPGSSGFPGSVGLPGRDGRVEAGSVAFGTANDLSTCSLTGRNSFQSTDGPVTWLATFSHRTLNSDEIRVRVELDGRQISDERQTPGVYDCIGPLTPETDLKPGFYSFEVVVNGNVEATGILFAG